MKTVLIQFTHRFAKKRMNWLNAAFLVILIILHHFSIGWMAQSRSIELIMAGGSIPGIGIISSVLGFILLRTTIVLLLPGFVFSWLCLEMIDFLQEKRGLESKKEGNILNIKY